jgi:hypothetical protein
LSHHIGTRELVIGYLQTKSSKQDAGLADCFVTLDELMEKVITPRYPELSKSALGAKKANLTNVLLTMVNKKELVKLDNTFALGVNSSQPRIKESNSIERIFKKNPVYWVN